MFFGNRIFLFGSLESVIAFAYNISFLARLFFLPVLHLLGKFAIYAWLGHIFIGCGYFFTGSFLDKKSACPNWSLPFFLDQTLLQTQSLNVVILLLVTFTRFQSSHTADDRVKKNCM
jgi:hypothetical protein